MRTFLTILLCLITFELRGAAINPLVGCLADEELRLHKEKKTGPVYKLNQLFLNDLVSAGDITLKEDPFKKVCVKPTFTPSVDLMREILIQGDGIFKLSINNLSNASIRSYQLSTIKEIKRVIPHIFFSYLSDLQSKMPTADCLGKYIPEITYFQKRFKYLEEELGSSPLMNETQKIQNIFKSLRDLSGIKNKCLEDKKIRSKKKN